MRAVDGVSFAVYPGQIVSVIGPNGSGKTTIFNLISGHLRPEAGEVRFAGAAITGLSPDRIAASGIARTFQNGRVFGNMTVEENILVGMHTRLKALRPLGGLRVRPLLRWVALLAETEVALAPSPRARREEEAAREKAVRELARFGDRLLPRRAHYAHSLSYANRRRTEIARALALEPRLLLLDEPTAGMNPIETQEVLEQIAEFRREGIAVLLIEHKLDLVMALSDHVVVLDDGRVIAEGNPAAIREDPTVVEAYLGRGLRERAEPMPARKGRVPAPKRQLELRDVDVFYGAVQALFKVSLRVDKGEIVCLLGGNASGKSTTMKTILGLLRPTAGAVLIEGSDATRLATPARIERGLASVPEARRVFAAMSVEDNLRMGAFRRADRAGIGQDLQCMYELFPRLAERRGQPAGTMSGGEQQMLAMARALMNRPKLLLMDEPTMGLAPVFVERVLDTIVTINRQSISIFMVEQNAAMALAIADRGYVIRNGVIVLDGEAEALLGNPTVQDAYLGRRERGAAKHQGAAT